MGRTRRGSRFVYGYFQKVKLYPNWKQIVRRAWSVRFMTMAAILSACEVVLPMYENNIPKNLFASLSFLCVTSAFIARIVAQRDV